MRKITSEEHQLSPVDALKVVEDQKRLRESSESLSLDLAALVDKYLKNENLQVEDYLFALARIAAAYIDNAHPSDKEPEERESIIDEYLRYFNMNLSAMEFDNMMKDKFMPKQQ